MAKLIGSVDHLGRPLVRLSDVGVNNEEILALVDTGFNGGLMMGHQLAKALEVELDEDSVRVELGNGAAANVHQGYVELIWLGRRRTAQVFASANWVQRDPDAPAALLGTGLLRPHLLLVDFEAATVEIETTT